MPNFSQRMGLKPLEKLLQRGSLDEATKNRLWNALKKNLWDKWEYTFPPRQKSGPTTLVNGVLENLWHYYFNWPLDQKPELNPDQLVNSSYQVVREYFFGSEWHETLDLIEFVLEDIYLYDEWKGNLVSSISATLIQENTAYRLINGKFSEITGEEEIKSILEAQKSPQSGVAEHLMKAANLLWDRKDPDYRNSIKESISAVESICRALTGDNSASLGKCLAELEKKTPMHPQFKSALNKLYEYTSDEGGIRHSLTEDSRTPTFAEAKFMLVTCSAFINFLKEAYPASATVQPKKGSKAK